MKNKERNAEFNTWDSIIAEIESIDSRYILMGTLFLLMTLVIHAIANGINDKANNSPNAFRM